MNLSSAAKEVAPLPADAESGVAKANDEPSQVIAPTVTPSSQTDTALPTKDDAIEMIVRARWWSPELTYKSEPLSTLFSHNSTEESGWLRTLLFPTYEDDNEHFNENLTLSYIFTVAEGKDMASAAAEAWGLTTEKAIAMRKENRRGVRLFPSHRRPSERSRL